jgi:hypothetical protein
MIGVKILKQSPPCGVRVSGIIIGTPLPGTLVTPVPGQGPTVSGRMQWQPLTPSADFSPFPQPGAFVLLEDELQGKTYKDPYVSGTRCFIYAPLTGEELNMLVTQPGTGTAPGFVKPGMPLGAAASPAGYLKAGVTSTGTVLFYTSEYTSEAPPVGTTSEWVLCMSVW